MKPLVAFFLLAAALATAGERLSPVNQPLAVLRSADPGMFEQLLETRQARALYRDGFDFSGRLPGLGARVDSLRGFFAGLRDAGAGNFWYCLGQGRTVLQQTGGMGWEMPAGGGDPDAVAAWLDGIGLAANKLRFAIGEADGQGLRIAAARDGNGLKELTAGKGNERWRRDLDAFSARSGSALGVWLNPRPLLGLAALAGGFDARPVLARLGLAVPESLELELRPKDGDLGFALRLGHALPAMGDAPAVAESVRIVDGGEAFLRIHVSEAERLLALFAPEFPPFALLNIDPEALRPRSASFALWRGGDGGVRWRAFLVFPSAEGFHRQWRKILAYAEAAADGGEGAAARRGDCLVVRHAGYGAVMRPVPVENGEGVALALAREEKDLPGAVAVERAAPSEAAAIAWEAALGEAERAEVARALWSVAALHGRTGISASAWDDMLPEREAGTITVEGESLSLASDRGLLPFLAAAWPELRYDWLPAADGDWLVLARLRFLLDVCHQFRYRDIGAGSLRPAPLPGDWREIAAVGAAWLDRGFERFPRSGETVSRLVSGLAAGRAVDGVRYRIEDDGRGWRLVAALPSGASIGLDASGRVVGR